MAGIATKHLRAAVALAEERSFSRAALKLRIGQSALTKQISYLEKHLGFELFSRVNREVIPTTAGETFVEQARLSLEYQDRAIQMSRAANEGMEHVLRVGKSPYTDPFFLTSLLSLRLPLFPNLKVEVTSRLAPDLAHDVLDGSLDLAFLTGIPTTPRLSSVAVGDQPFFIAMLEDDPLALREEIGCADLENTSCILFERHVHPYLYDALVREAKPASSFGRSLHHMMTAEEGANLIRSGLGVAVLTQSGAWRIAKNGITMRPLNCQVRLETRLACRSDSGARIISEFFRAFVRRLEKRSTTRPALTVKAI